MPISKRSSVVPLWIAVVFASALATLAGGCGGPTQSTASNGAHREPPTTLDSVTCGNQSCGPREYCLIECTCCGMRIPDPSEASASYRCMAIPDSCDPAAMCGCEDLHRGLCSPERRTVETPCA